LKDTVIVGKAGRYYKLTPKALAVMKKLHKITGISEDDPQAYEKMTKVLIEVHKRRQKELSTS